MSKRIFILVYLLTIIDVVFSYIGLKLNYIQEFNPVMNYFINLSLPLTMAAVLVGAAILLYLIYSLSYFRWIAYAMAGVLVVKLIVVGMHAVWIYQVLR